MVPWEVNLQIITQHMGSSIGKGYLYTFCSDSVAQ